MIDIQLLRNNPQDIKKQLQTRGYTCDIEKIVQQDKKVRVSKTQIQILQNQRNEDSKKIAVHLQKQETETANQIKQSLSTIKQEIAQEKKTLNVAQDILFNMLMVIPNIPDENVPLGKDENDNITIKTVGDIPTISQPQPHWELAERYMDVQSAVSMAGSRFTMLHGPLAKLYRILGQFMLEEQIKEGFTEYTVPFLLKPHAMYYSGQLPVLENDMYKVLTSTKDINDNINDNGNHQDITNNAESYLIPTGESSLINCFANKILDNLLHPRRITTLTPCFRKESGAAGKDTRGLIRLHQFHKVEMVSITTQEQSLKELEFITACASRILEKLQIPYRVISLCTGDLGFHASQTFDIEAWMPAQHTYREISSCSNCKDFQARRMQTKYRDKSQALTFVHTLNGSGLAVDRTLAVILENYQLPDGKIRIPPVLQKAFGAKYLDAPHDI